MAVLAVPGKTAFLGADMDRWAQRVERLPKSLLSIVVLLLTAFIGFFDYVTETDVSLSAFYLLPVALAARFIGPVFALVAAALSVVMWLGGDVLVGRQFPDVFLVVWN